MRSASPERNRSASWGHGARGDRLFLRDPHRLPRRPEDQDHAPVLIWSDPRVPARTDAILQGGPSPLPALLTRVRLLERGGAGLLVMPCITAHHYTRELTAAASVPFVNLIEESSASPGRDIPELRRIGLLGRHARERSGPGSSTRPSKGRASRSSPPLPAIRSASWRLSEEIKAGRIAGRPRAAIVRAARGLVARGAEAVIAGCTEVPLALRPGDLEVPLIEPMAIGARACIRKAGGRAARGAASPGHD